MGWLDFLTGSYWAETPDRKNLPQGTGRPGDPANDDKAAAHGGLKDLVDHAGTPEHSDHAEISDDDQPRTKGSAR